MSKVITQQQIEEFKIHLYNEEKALATIEKYLHDISSFFVWTSGRMVDKSLVLAYKQKLIENYAPSSVNSMLSAINCFFEFHGWPELQVKTLKIQRQLFAHKEKELGKEEYQRLLMAAKRRHNEQLNLLMQTICACGLRVSELRYVTVEAVKRRQATIQCKGKLRQAFLPEKLCKMLMKYAKEKKITSGPIFITQKGIPLDRSNIWKKMKSLCEDAGVSKEKVFPHNLRHLFAREYYTIERDIVRLADILGHSNINTTRIYTVEAV